MHKIINHHGKPPIHQLLSNQPRGTTTHNSPHTTPPLHHSPTTTTNRPPTSGNPGDNGKIIPIPPTHHIHPSGLTTPNHQLATMILMTLPQSHSQHSPPTTPHLIARRNDHQAHRGSDQSQAPANVPPGHVAITFKKVPRKSGSETSSMP